LLRRLYCHIVFRNICEKEIDSIKNILKNHNQRASSPNVSRNNITIHMKINREDDIADLVNNLVRSCPRSIEIVPHTPYYALWHRVQTKHKDQSQFLILSVLGYCVTLIWIIASNYYSNNLNIDSLKDGFITSFFPTATTFIYKIIEKFNKNN